MAITGYLPGSTGQYLKVQDWARTIEVPAYEKMQFIPTLDEVGRPYSQMNLRFWDTLSPTTLGTTTFPANANLTWSTGTPSTLALTPSAIYVAVGYGQNQKDMVEVDTGSGIRANIEGAIAEGCDAVLTATISNLTNGIGDANTSLTAGDLHKLATQLRIASPAVMVGVQTVHACLHPGGMLGLLDDSTLMNAEIRGDSENPQVNGIFAKAAGMLFRFTTKVKTDGGNGGEGAVYVPEAFAVGWNQRPMVSIDSEPLAKLYVGYASLGGRVKWDSRARYCRTVVSV